MISSFVQGGGSPHIKSFVTIGGLLLCFLIAFIECAPTKDAVTEIEKLQTSRNINDDTANLQKDEDVLELEELKHTQLDNNNDRNGVENILPSLEKQLSETVDSKVADGRSSQSENGKIGISEDTDDDANTENIDKEKGEAPSSSSSSATFSSSSSTSNDGNDTKSNQKTKTFYGAARLAFGQKPDSLSPPSTVTTTIQPEMEDINIDEGTPSEVSANGEKRSLNLKGAKSAEYLLHHSGNQYSPYDMAQYVFWTGDEEGVARAVEEFIQKGLMTRENAIKFLRDISMGIEYLENSYSNRQQNDQHSTMHTQMDFIKPSMKISSTTTTTTSIPPIIIEQHHQQLQQDTPTMSPTLQKTLQNLPSLLKLNEINNEKMKDDSIDLDDMAGRLRLADFLYAEYSLEEVIYQLAKVMFSQSLTRGSEQAQVALQRLTEFLESEGAHGRISPALQKKILDVLLAALSDCLSEHPELIPIARIGLAGATTMEQLPKHMLNNKE